MKIPYENTKSYWNDNIQEKKLFINKECCNESFSFDELLECFQNSYDTAVGPDQIHSQTYKYIFSVYSILYWERGHFPLSWSQATNITIPKPVKGNIIPNNYQQNMYQRILQQRFILIAQMLLLQLLIISLYGVIFPPKVKAIEFDFENVKT